MTFDEWISSFPEDERNFLCLVDAWDAAIRATVQELLDSGNLSEYYRQEWTATANKLIFLSENRYANKD